MSTNENPRMEPIADIIENQPSGDNNTEFNVNTKGMQVSLVNSVNANEELKEELDRLMDSNYEWLLNISWFPEYKYKAGTDIYIAQYFKDLANFIDGTRLPHFLRNALVKMFKVNKTSQLAYGNISFDYLEAEYLGKSVTDINLLRELMVIAKRYGYHLLEQVEIKNILKDIPTLGYDEHRRSDVNQNIISEIYKKAGVRMSLYPINADICVFIMCALKLSTPKRGHKLNGPANSIEKFILHTDIDQEWRDKNTIETSDDLICSLKGFKAATSGLPKGWENYLYLIIWTQTMSKRMNDDLKRDFLYTMMMEINRCVDNQEEFDEKVLGQFYHRCLITNKTDLLPQGEPHEISLTNLLKNQLSKPKKSSNNIN